GLPDRRKRLHPAVEHLSANDALVLVLGLGVLVGRREETPQGRVVARFQQRLELGGQRAQQLLLGRPQPQSASGVAGPCDLPAHQAGQSCRIVAQSPCACRRETSYSAFSRVPLETTALPSLCT